MKFKLIQILDLLCSWRFPFDNCLSRWVSVNQAFINSIQKQLITPALKFFQERGGANIPMQLAGASMAIIPVIVLFVMTQKYFVAGVSSSGIKG